jgi:hypothetical protein
LAEYERGDSGEALVRLAQSHDGAGKHHAEQRAKHEDAKRKHLDLMTKWRILTSTVIPKEQCCERRIVT